MKTYPYIILLAGLPKGIAERACENARRYYPTKWDEACEEQKASINDFYSHHFPINSEQVDSSPKPEFKP